MEAPVDVLQSMRTRGLDGGDPVAGPPPLPSGKTGYVTSLIHALGLQRGRGVVSPIVHLGDDRYDILLRFLVSQGRPMPDWLNPRRVSEASKQSSGSHKSTSYRDGRNDTPDDLHFLPYDPAFGGRRPTEIYFPLGLELPKKPTFRLPLKADKRANTGSSCKRIKRLDEVSVCVVDVELLEIRLVLSLLSEIQQLLDEKTILRKGPPPRETAHLQKERQWLHRKQGQEAPLQGGSNASLRVVLPDISLKAPEGPPRLPRKQEEEGDWLLAVYLEASVLDASPGAPEAACEEILRSLPAPRESAVCEVKAAGAQIKKALAAAAEGLTFPDPPAVPQSWSSKHRRHHPTEGALADQLATVQGIDLLLSRGVQQFPISGPNGLTKEDPRRLLVHLPLSSPSPLLLYLPLCCEEDRCPEASALTLHITLSCRPSCNPTSAAVALAEGWIEVTTPRFFGLVQLSPPRTFEQGEAIRGAPSFSGVARVNICCRGLRFRQRGPPPQTKEKEDARKDEAPNHEEKASSTSKPYRASTPALSSSRRGDSQKQQKLQEHKYTTGNAEPSHRPSSLREGTGLSPHPAGQQLQRPLQLPAGSLGASQREDRLSQLEGAQGYVGSHFDRPQVQLASTRDRMLQQPSLHFPEGASSTPLPQGPCLGPPATDGILSRCQPLSAETSWRGPMQQSLMPKQAADTPGEQRGFFLPNPIKMTVFLNAEMQTDGEEKPLEMQHQSHQVTKTVVSPGDLTLGLRPVRQKEPTGEQLLLEKLLIELQQDPSRLYGEGLVWARTPGNWPASIPELRSFLSVLKTYTSNARCSVHLVSLYCPDVPAAGTVGAAAPSTSNTGGMYILHSVAKRELLDPCRYIRALLQFFHVTSETMDNPSKAHSLQTQKEGRKSPLTMIDSPLVVRLHAIYHDCFCVHVLREWLPPPATKLSHVVHPLGRCVFDEAAARGVLKQVLEVLQLLEKQQTRGTYVQLTPDVIYLRGDGGIALDLPKAARFCNKQQMGGPAPAALLYKPSFQYPLAVAAAEECQPDASGLEASTTPEENGNDDVVASVPLAYLAPEELQATSSAAPTSGAARARAADIWRGGGLAFHLLTGGPPFVTNSRQALKTLLEKRGTIGTYARKSVYFVKLRFSLLLLIEEATVTS